MKYLSVLSGLLLPLSLASAALAQSTYPKPVVDKLLADCSAGAPAAQCQCVVSAIQTKISLDDFNELDAAIKAQKPLSEKQNTTLKSLVESRESCAKPAAK
jgi:hypothetical protein